MTSLLSRRSMFAGSASLTFHVALVLLALVLAGLRAVSPPPIAPLAIEVIEPALAPPPSGPAIGTVEGAGHTALAGDPGKRGPTAARRSVSHAPPVRDPYADVVMGYDAPTLDQPG
ncbi:MAG TPA: hypothetical protein VFP84_25770, partial [Kofleriaceae bacterium]|nr:hypothetical protein [Kofleriaceae bacterium]